MVAFGERLATAGGLDDSVDCLFDERFRVPVDGMPGVECEQMHGVRGQRGELYVTLDPPLHGRVIEPFKLAAREHDGGEIAEVQLGGSSRVRFMSIGLPPSSTRITPKSAWVNMLLTDESSKTNRRSRRGDAGRTPG